MASPLDVGHASADRHTAGFPTTIGDSFDAAYDVAYRVDSLLGVEAEVQSRWENSIREYEAVTGRAAGVDTSLRVVGGLINPSIVGDDRGLARSFQGLDLNLYRPGDTPEDRLQKAREFNEQLRGLGIAPIEDILDEVVKARGLAIEREAEVSETGGFTGMLGGFAGGIAGTLAAAFSGRDPIQLIALGLGGGGKSIAARIATEAGINAAVEGVVQEAGIQPTRRAFGEPEGDTLQAMLVAGAAGGLFRGGVEGVGVLASRYLDRERPGITLDFDDAQLRSMLEAAPQTPEVRAGQLALAEDGMFVRANPYADTDAGLRRFEGEVDQVWRTLNGQTDTAVSRINSGPDEFTLDNLDYHAQVIREQQPQVFSAVEEASARINEIDEQIAALTDRLDNMTLSEGVARIDEDAGNLLRSYEEDLANPQLTAPQEDIIRRADQVVQTLGEANVERELSNAAIAPRKELQRLRQERKAATKRFRAARDVFDQAVERVKAAERLRQATAPTPSVMAPVAGSRFNMTDLRKDVVEANSRAVDDLHSRKDEVAESIVRGMETEEGIDLGDGTIVPKDFRIGDPDNPANEITAAALLRRLKEDEELVEAMRTCSL